MSVFALHLRGLYTKDPQRADGPARLAATEYMVADVALVVEEAVGAVSKPTPYSSNPALSPPS
ncbi:hypothetical protein OAH08_03655 [Verrucomicrobia bacterium]|nr:hypothetical protein [Verrucomicrobiota bacterium]